MTYHYSKEIDNDILIEEVKSRPALYDKSLKEYNDYEHKKLLWEQIHNILYVDKWQYMSETEKELRGTEVIKRWNNLRTCFTRELKIMKDPANIKRRKYIYFNQLMFLMGEGSEIYKLDNPKNTEEPSRKPNISSRRLMFNRMKNLKYRLSQQKEIRNQFNQKKEESFKNRTEEESVSKTFDTDPDTNFALSLVPTLKNIPTDKKLDAQIEILSILKKYTKEISDDFCVIKYERVDPLTSEGDETETLPGFEENK